MMRLEHRELACLETICSLNPDLFNMLGRRAVSVAILVSEWIVRVVKRFDVDITKLVGIVRHNPAAILVVSDVRKRETKAGVSGEVPALITVNVTFINLTGPKERQMRIHEEQRVPTRALCWTNDPAVLWARSSL